MKILFFGDIVGSSGRQAVATQLSFLKEQYQPDVILANGENAAHGKGITQKIYNEFVQEGIQGLTLGNHSFSKKEILEVWSECPQLIRPANLEPLNDQEGVLLLEVQGKKLAVVNLMGQVFMDHVVESPFVTMERILQTVPAEGYFVDFHGEATSEKEAFFWHFKDRCMAVVGTHTHVQTADEQVHDGCGFICDVGMCGAFESILGRDTEEVLRKMLTEEKTRFTPSSNPGMVSAVCLTYDESWRCTAIERIQLRPKQ